MNNASAIDIRPQRTPPPGGWLAYCEASRMQGDAMAHDSASKPSFKEEEHDGRRR